MNPTSTFARKNDGLNFNLDVSEIGYGQLETYRMEETHGALSLAQVEEELRSAEAYLSASLVLPPAPSGVRYDAFQREMNPTETEPEDSTFRRKLKTRPILSEERRREILAKLSSERQAALRGRPTGQNIAETMVEDAFSAPLNERTYRTPEVRHHFIQKLLGDRSMDVSSEPVKVQDANLGGSLGHLDDTVREDELAGELLNADNDAPSVGSDDDFEIYYASDILDTANASEIQPRSRLDFISEGESGRGPSSEALPSLMESSMEVPGNEGQVDTPVSRSLVAMLFERKQEAEKLESEAVDAKPIGEDDHYADIPWPTNEHQDRTYTQLDEATNIDERQTLTKKASSRIDFLAQPRNHTFAEREKERIRLEMEQLQECTFRPNVIKPPQSIPKTKGVNKVNTTGRPGPTEFQWLTLSPRQKKSRRGGGKEIGSENVVQRLHLDGTSRYDSREQARKALEAQKLEECTFKPQINLMSKSMFSMADYKPIHHRISDLQRAKADYIERIREQLDQEEYGTLPFVPMINPKSKEIPSNKLAEREVEDSNQPNKNKPKSQNVTERLAENADAIAERRLATQEYFDMLNEQPFTPQISEASKKIVEQKPEFKMDFVERQQYFQSRDQEKLEALEGFCEMDYARGEKLTFKPDIGNAEGVLKHLRPDRSTESSQQRLYRLTYNDQREAELKKQRLREEQYAQYTFKPDINPVSKALGRTPTLDELSHPVLDIQHDPPLSKRSPPQHRTNYGDSPVSRVALRQYFANKRFRSRVALEMEEASKAECTFQPKLVASKYRNGSTSTGKLYNRDPRSRTKLEWQSENLLHLIEADRQKKADEIEAKRNEKELKELEECTFRPNLQKPRRKGNSGEKGSPSPPRDTCTEDKPVIVRGLGRFLELRDLARKQQAEQKQREQKVFVANTSYEPRSYTVPKPFKLSETSKDSIRRRLKVREEMRAKEREECTFQPQTVSSQSRRVLHNMLNN